jgi:hypothetical protein
MLIGTSCKCEPAVRRSDTKAQQNNPAHFFVRPNGTRLTQQLISIMVKKL